MLLLEIQYQIVFKVHPILHILIHYTLKPFNPQGFPITSSIIPLLSRNMKTWWFRKIISITIFISTDGFFLKIWKSSTKKLRPTSGEWPRAQLMHITHLSKIRLFFPREFFRWDFAFFKIKLLFCWSKKIHQMCYWVWIRYLICEFYQQSFSKGWNIKYQNIFKR